MIKSLISWLFLTLIVIGFAIFSGSYDVKFDKILVAGTVDHNIVFNLRLPRIIAAIIVGGLLAISGLMMQNLVKNPLADPYILGVSGASACIQLLLISSGLLIPNWLILFLSFIFALGSLVFLIKLSYHNGLNTQKLILSGVVLAFAYAAIISLILTLSPANTIKPMLFWLMGDLGYSRFLWLGGIILFIGTFVLYKKSIELDILARGEIFAKKSGVNTTQINMMVLIVTTLFTTIAVNIAGTIGFVGLVVPHIVRLVVANNHKKLILFSAIFGSLFLVITDTLARTLVAPTQLPVGVFTALIGVPLFLILQWRRS